MAESILIHVNYFQEGEFWTVSAFKYETDAGPDDPKQIDDTEDFREQAPAVSLAESWAEMIQSQRQAKRATILINGSEHLCLQTPDVAA